MNEFYILMYVISFISVPVYFELKNIEVNFKKIREILIFLNIFLGIMAFSFSLINFYEQASTYEKSIRYDITKYPFNEIINFKLNILKENGYIFLFNEFLNFFISIVSAGIYFIFRTFLKPIRRV